MKPLHNHSFTGNYASDASNARPSASASGSVSAYLKTIPLDSISPTTTFWLNQIRISGDADHQFVAANVQEGLNDGSLVRASKPKHSDPRYSYAKRIPLGRGEGYGLLMAKVALNTEGKFDISEVGLRQESGKAMKFPLADNYRQETQRREAPPRPGREESSKDRHIRKQNQRLNMANSGKNPEQQYAGQAAQQNITTAPPSSYGYYAGYQDELTQPGPSRLAEALPASYQRSPSVQPLLTQSAISREHQKSVKTVVNSLNKWDQKTAKALIESKLHSEPTETHQAMLQQLRSQLSQQLTADKPAAIRQWAENASLQSAIQGRDLRTDQERALQNTLENYLRDPVFREHNDAIRAMFSVKERRNIMLSDITDGRYYHSPLYSRVFSGAKSPVDNIAEIRTYLAGFNDSERHQALKEWQPER